MNKIVLEQDGVSIVMDAIRRNTSAGTLSCRFITNFRSCADARIPPRDCLFLISDLRGMSEYVRAHIGENAPHAISSSNAFVTYDATFKLHALGGELESWSDGYFTARWMFYSGPNDRVSAAIYLGVEARVEVIDALEWCDQLDALASSA